MSSVCWKKWSSLCFVYFSVKLTILSSVVAFITNMTINIVRLFLLIRSIRGNGDVNKLAIWYHALFCLCSRHAHNCLENFIVFTICNIMYGFAHILHACFYILALSRASLKCEISNFLSQKPISGQFKTMNVYVSFEAIDCLWHPLCLGTLNVLRIEMFWPLVISQNSALFL